MYFERNKKVFLFLFSALALKIPQNAFSEGDFSQPVFKAMETEMQRSLSQLKFEDFIAPYFLSYQLLDSKETLYSARYGTLVQDQSFRNRYFYVELRYGNYEMDNTDENYRGLFDSAPLEDDEAGIRHRLWLMTDQAYKQAVRDYLQKKGKKISEIEKEKIADFSKEKSNQTIQTPIPSPMLISSYKPILKATSAEFKKYREILDSGLTLRYSQQLFYALNSEGSRILMPNEENPFFIYVWARTQSDDGMNLDVSRTFSVRSLEKLPTEKKLNETIEEMAGKLLKLRDAKLTDPYTGPAILDSESTGVLFHEAVGHRLEGERQRDEEEGQTFKGQVGKVIIPTFLTVIDDPTTFEAHTIELNGSYSFDDEGVPAQKVILIENGILKNYLMSRRPIAGFNHSNGHGRAQFGRDPIGRMSNLFVNSSKEFSQSELKKMLLEECGKQKKPYGLLIRRTRSGDTFTGRGRYQAFRGTPEEVFLVDAKTGKETLVRGVELVGTPLITINKIIATGKDYHVLNAFCGAESGNIPVSTIAPSSLVKEVELQRVREDKQRPPILPPPLYEASSSK
jgi:TldD protein